MNFSNTIDNGFDWGQLIWIAIIIAIIFLLYIILLLIRRFVQKHNILPADWQLVVLRLTIPKIKSKDGQDDKIQESQELIAKAEGLFSTLGGMKAQRGIKAWFYGRYDIFSFEIVVNKGLINFYVAVPQINKQYLEEQLNAVYPHVYIEEVQDYNIFQAQSLVVSAALKFKREYIFPIKSYKKIESDPINSLTNTLSKFDEHEGAAVQYIVRSALPGWHAKGNKVASEMQQGKKLDEALKSAGIGSTARLFVGFFSEIGKQLFGSKKDELAKSNDYHMTQTEQEMTKGIEEKTSKAGFDVNVRLIVSTNVESLAKQKMTDLINAFSQYSIYQYGNSFNSFVFTSGKKRDKTVNDYIYRSFVDKYRMLLNAEEMVSLWHLPLATNETPNIDWMKARKAAPPVDLPTEGVILGISDYRGVKRTVRLRREDRRRHVYIIGQTGTGKSTMMKNMMIQDIQNGEGCCIIDPHGDFALDVLKNIPKERAEDVIYFNPADTERPLSINMLEYNSPEQKTFVVNELLGIFDKLYDLKATGGPMFEQYMRNALLLVMEDPESGMTLMEVPRVLSDEKFRRYKLSKCNNPSVKEFWEKEAQKAGGEAALANMVPYITSKLTPFIANDIMRPIISQQKSSLDFRKIMDEKKILIVNLTKGKLGDINSSLLGMVIVGKILLASLSRVDMSEKLRQDFYLYIDEFQNFTTDSISIILSEARKYKLNLIIANQYISQLVKNNDTRIRDAVFGNVGTTIAYRVGVDDAEILAKQFAPVFDGYDVVNIPKYTAYVKLLIDNANPPAFNIAVQQEPDGSEQMRDALIELSRFRYGRDRNDIENEISLRSSKITEIA